MRSNYRDALFDRMGSAGANHAALKGDVSMNIYVGNLSRDVAETDLREAFQAFGEVATASVIKDKYT
jgi:RNA recognition motif-containing protein